MTLASGAHLGACDIVSAIGRASSESRERTHIVMRPRSARAAKATSRPSSLSRNSRSARSRGQRSDDGDRMGRAGWRARAECCAPQPELAGTRVTLLSGFSLRHR